MAGINIGGAISDIGSAANDLIQGQATEEADTLKAQGDLAEAEQPAFDKSASRGHDGPGSRGASQSRGPALLRHGTGYPGHFPRGLGHQAFI